MWHSQLPSACALGMTFIEEKKTFEGPVLQGILWSFLRILVIFQGFSKVFEGFLGFFLGFSSLGLFLFR